MTEHGGTPTAPAARPDHVIRAELAELRRFLAETPPHHGAGVRTSLEARIDRLERELASR